MTQKHTLSEVFLDRDSRDQTLCVQPSERTQFFLNIPQTTNTGLLSWF
jgi:hypothetical protein